MNFNVIHNIHYYDDVLDLKFLMIDNDKTNFYNFGVKIYGLSADHEWAYDETNSFFTWYIKCINELLSNEKDSKLVYDGQGPFMVDDGFVITQTLDPDTYNFCNERIKFNLVISRNTLINIKNTFETVLLNVDNLLHH